MSIALTLGTAIVPVQAASERSLFLYYTHTKETARIVFKRNGRYVTSGLSQLNYFLRDWRRNEPAKMDPKLFDLIWEVYQEVGATQPINVVSAYRAPATNEMLRSRAGSGVAKDSQHTKGHAMDFFIPGISLTKLRAVAMKKQVGGVGYYPTSGSPFVHLDTGNVRAWPRMTRAQLKQVFPDGKTLHVPTDGKPLSNTGRQYALAQWQRCHMVPCNGTSSRTEVASAEPKRSGTTLMDLFFGDDAGDDEDQVTATSASPVQSASVSQPRIAPTPFMRPAGLGEVIQVAAAPEPGDMPFSRTGSQPLEAPQPAMKSSAMLVATAAALPPDQTGETALTALAELGAPIPAARVLMSAGQSDIVTAYAPSPAEPGAQRAVEMIIDRTNTASIRSAPDTVKPAVTMTGADGLRTASLAGGSELGALANLFDLTWGAVEDDASTTPIALALAKRTIGKPREVELIAPDLEHVADVFMTPVVMTSEHFAVIYDHDEADFSPETELGADVTRMGVGDEPPAFSHEKFVSNAPMTVALR
ncbi:DUF882 domain-containing protein [Devosia algicola]|uniref:Murein endopeptidase K n=1 Tax=Devosia algicola TaxID=3026418 RepID=A0ABY7YJ29_9HYPH|nr:DUF882 domain-containing protein [Devosia algicola]